jgi:hypothetical protein
MPTPNCNLTIDIGGAVAHHQRSLPAYVANDDEADPGKSTLLQIIVTKESVFVGGTLVQDEQLPESLNLRIANPALAAPALAQVFEAGVDSGAFDPLIERDRNLPDDLRKTRDFFGYKRQERADEIVCSHKPLPADVQIENIPDGAFSMRLEYRDAALPVQAVVEFDHGVTAHFYMVRITPNKVRLVGMSAFYQPLWTLRNGYDQDAIKVAAILLKPCLANSASTAPPAESVPVAS